ncbi:hypothetical protein Tsubulata_012067 [Turnera subulata]|uniref:Endonuclease/exonuclease/phosphatase domain-containing protein n=1 Tax=Turnera subulata TaxID=218843 RepID=A0A9Q0FB48_9ROSI|nr:hypothetical protein Tsubulata_012067 [Turnera subulata]
MRDHETGSLRERVRQRSRSAERSGERHPSRQSMEVEPSSPLGLRTTRSMLLPWRFHPIQVGDSAQPSSTAAVAQRSLSNSTPSNVNNPVQAGARGEWKNAPRRARRPPRQAPDPTAKPSAPHHPTQTAPPKSSNRFQALADTDFGEETHCVIFHGASSSNTQTQLSPNNHPTSFTSPSEKPPDPQLPNPNTIKHAQPGGPDAKPEESPLLDEVPILMEVTSSMFTQQVDTSLKGATKKQFVRNFREICKIIKPAVVVIVEPRLSGIRAWRKIQRLGFTHSHRVEARGYAGGIWLLWNNDFVHVQILLNHTQLVHVRVTQNQTSFLFTAIYASQQEKWRQFCWRNLEVLSPNTKEPWLLGGDFNAILSGEERRNRFGLNGVANKNFQKCVVRAKLIDLDHQGSEFTWRRAGDQARLDRFLCNDLWRVSFPEASVTHLPYSCSDHRPIVIQNGVSPPPRATRPFRFQAAWLTNPGFGDLVKKEWDANINVVQAVENFIPKLQWWNKTVFGNIHRRKKRILARLAGIQKYLERMPSKFLSNLELELRMELDSVLVQEELLWAQKARCQWIQEGDRNTAYFHATTIIRRKRNKVEALIDADGKWQQDNEMLKSVATNYFQNLFSDEGSIGWRVCDGQTAKFWSDKWILNDTRLWVRSGRVFLLSLAGVCGHGETNGCLNLRRSIRRIRLDVSRSLPNAAEIRHYPLLNPGSRHPLLVQLCNLGHLQEEALSR